MACKLSTLISSLQVLIISVLLEAYWNASHVALDSCSLIPGNVVLSLPIALRAGKGELFRPSKYCFKKQIEAYAAFAGCSQCITLGNRLSVSKPLYATDQSPSQ
jgi:hypothetical protein